MSCTTEPLQVLARLRANRARAHEPRRGFTLIELLVVVAIIATLAAVVAPSIFRNVGDAKTASARTQLEVFALALSQYRLDNGSLPSTEQGLAALRALPTVPDAEGNLPGN